MKKQDVTSETKIKKKKTSSAATINKQPSKKDQTNPDNSDTDSKDERLCKCLKIIGHLEDVKWMMYPWDHRPSPGLLAMGDWTMNPFIWLHYVERSDGILADDDVLLTKETAHWEINDVQRYFVGDLHCEQVLFPYQYPYPRMPTVLGDQLWRAGAALKSESNVYQRELRRTLDTTLKKIAMSQVQLDRLVLPDRIVKLGRYDHFGRQTFFRLLCNILSFQDRLQLVSFENLCCKRLEGVNLILHLASFNAQTLKYLFLWRFVLPNENPILVNYSYITGSGQYIPRPDSRYTFLRSLGELRNLRLLALEYAHIADGTGAALLSLLPVIKRPHFRLQLICREDQVPGCNDAALGVGGYDIPDTAWRRVVTHCPDIYLLLAFFYIRHYDNLRRFLTPSMPLREVHYSFGIDMKRLNERQDSDVSCFVRHVAYRYANSLVTLSIHQWRFAVFPLRRILELMPRLVRLIYVGRVEDELDLKRSFQIIACGVCKNLKQIKIQIQDEEMKMSYWRDVVHSLTEEYSDIMQLYDIKFCISLYKS